MKEWTAIVSGDSGELITTVGQLAEQSGLSVGDIGQALVDLACVGMVGMNEWWEEPEGAPIRLSAPQSAGGPAMVAIFNRIRTQVPGLEAGQ